MARGKPFLAIVNIGSGTIVSRLFRLDSNDIFTSLSTLTTPSLGLSNKESGVFFSGDLSPKDYLFTYGSLSPSGNVDISAKNLPDLSMYRGYSASDGRRNAYLLRKSGLWGISAFDGQAANLFYWNEETTDLQALSGYLGTAQLFNEVVKGAVSEDDLYLARIQPPVSTVDGSLHIAVMQEYDENGFPKYLQSTLQATFTPTFPNGAVWHSNCVKFSFDTRRLFIAGYDTTADQSYVDMILLDTSTSPANAGTVPSNKMAKWKQRIVETIGQARCLAVHPNNRFVAVGFVTADGITATTRIYKVENDTLSLHTTLNGIGSGLDFTLDGKYLIDAIRKKVYTFSSSDVFTENLTMMANVPVGAVIQGISRHVDTQPVGELYDAGAELLLKSNPASLDLHLKYLDRYAFFQPHHSTINEVTNNGGFELNGMDIPVDGYPLNNIQTEKISGSRYRLKADNLASIGLVARSLRYAVIYDRTSGIPITLMNFHSTIEWEASSKITIPLTSGFVYYNK